MLVQHSVGAEAYTVGATTYTAGAAPYMHTVRIKLTQSSCAEAGTEFGKINFKCSIFLISYNLDGLIILARTNANAVLILTYCHK